MGVGGATLAATSSAKATNLLTQIGTVSQTQNINILVDAGLAHMLVTVASTGAQASLVDATGQAVPFTDAGNGVLFAAVNYPVSGAWSLVLTASSAAPYQVQVEVQGGVALTNLEYAALIEVGPRSGHEYAPPLGSTPPSGASKAALTIQGAASDAVTLSYVTEDGSLIASYPLARASSLAFTGRVLVPSSAYWVKVSGLSASGGSFMRMWRGEHSLPDPMPGGRIVVDAPESMTYAAGSTGKLSVRLSNVGADENLTLTARSSLGGVTVTPSTLALAANTASSAELSLAVPTGATAGDLVLTVTSSTGARDVPLLIRILTAAVKPVCTLSVAPSSIAAGSSSTLTAACTGIPTSYTWMGATGCASTASTCTVSPTSTTTYSVAGTNAAGTGTAASATVSVSATGPTCTIASNPSVIAAGSNVVFTATCTNSPTLYTWTVGGQTKLSGDAACCSKLTTSFTAGAHTIALTATNAAGTSNAATLTINVDGTAGPQAITFPAVATIAVGSSASLSATASSGLPVAYSSSSTNCVIAGSATAGFTVQGKAIGNCTITAAQEGNASFAAAAPVSQVVVVSAASGKLVNLSTRAFVGTGDDVLIAGFIISGGAKRVMIMAEGPNLATLGVNGVLPDPMLTLFNSSGVAIANNDNYQESPDWLMMGLIGIRPKNPLESGILMTLAPGAYTAIVQGVGGQTGIALVSVHDTDDLDSPARLANISSRARAATDGDAQIIAGFIIKGGSKNVLLKGMGPSLAAQGVAGALDDPAISAFQGSTSIGNSDNWSSEAGADVITATGRGPDRANESAMVSTLAEGAYTVIMRGTRAPGVGLLSVDELLTAAQSKALGATALSLDIDKAFASVEALYGPELGKPDGVTQSKAGYRYRTYSGAHVLAVNEEGVPHMHYMGPLSGGMLQDLGLLTKWLGSPSLSQ